jgi:hypothetical protein
MLHNSMLIIAASTQTIDTSGFGKQINLQLIDYLILGIYLAFVIGIGFALKLKWSRKTEPVAC